MYDKDSGPLAVSLGWSHQIAADGSVSGGRVHRRTFLFNARVILRYLFRPSIVRAQRFEQCGCGPSSDCKFLSTLKEVSARYVAVHIFIKEVQQFLRELARFSPLHNFSYVK